VQAQDGALGIFQITQPRHRPLYAGDPISFLKRKMGCPDKPGNDNGWVSRFDALT
jgi:hypothetical protein